MIHEVRASMFFDSIEEAADFLDNCRDALEKAVVVNPGQDNQQGCSIELIKCYHDETPTSPCEVIGITTSP